VMNRVRARIGEVVATMAAAVGQTLERHDVELIQGDARLGPDRTVIVRGPDGRERTLQAGVVLLATGSRPYHPRTSLSRIPTSTNPRRCSRSSGFPSGS
jgi:pyruvate/2-oxoglutarate dehydrogenase complex dihydrolipoamide dehydrogenase (E3) component